ncbi:MAG TPA: mechanosensitive ion channel [Euryarchaeota archaeon]|nr:mechanosensitive ion channel [Euryarchaeota archaeon]
MDFNEILNNNLPVLKAYFLPVLVLFGLVVGVLFLFGYMTLLFNFLRKKESRFLAQPTIDMIERILQIALSIALVVYFVFLLQLIIPWIHHNVWIHLVGFLPTAITIAIILSLAIVLIRILNTFTDYLKGGLTVKPIKAIKEEYITIVSLMVRYLIYAFSAIGILFVIIVSIGFKELLFTKISTFFIDNIAFLIFIGIILFTTYFLNKFVTSFFKDLSDKSSKFSPQMVRGAGTGLRIAIFFLAVLLVIFAILNMANLGGISQTILLIGTTMVGLVIAMAGTGSIGNALSGAVIIVFRPFKNGDRVVFMEDKLICDVVETTIIFTRVKNLQGEVMEIPNNLVLAHPIKNLTMSTPFGVSVTTTIGYDIHHDTVTRLMKEAAKRTQGIILFPEPQVYLTDLSNHAIEYQLVAYTNQDKIRRIRSEIMRNMQDVFYENGVEILSPIYEVRRQGSVVETKVPPKMTRVAHVGKIDEVNEDTY